jgi:cobalamin biosynthesis Co2+ chelatase CbiK
MNLGKTIKELTNRLDVIYPYPSSSTSNEIRHDGIHYWKGKKIISAKEWNDLYEKNSKYTDNYKIMLVSRKLLQYFPDDYNGSITSFNEELKEEAQRWNKEYYELLEFRKNPTLGRNKCIGCIFSTLLDDPFLLE